MTASQKTRFALGDKVFVVNDWGDSLPKGEYQIQTNLTVISFPQENYISLSNGQLRHIASVFPETGDCLEDAREIIARRSHLKRQFDDSMALVYEFRNKVARREYDPAMPEGEYDE